MGMEPRRPIRVVVLGASGMLGSTVMDVLKGAPNFDLNLRATTRQGTLDPSIDDIEVVPLDVTAPTQAELERVLDGCKWAVNCIGLIKHHIREDQRESTERAVRVNALFPHLLAETAQSTECRVLQIATDCVFSGATGLYLESDPHDATDVYGHSKSLGEVHSTMMHHLRCSIIGPELKNCRSLLEWFLSHPQGAKVQGYSNHFWNGVTTLQYARICLGIIRGGMHLPHLCHVVPEDVMHKGDLLMAMGRAFRREDIKIDIQPAASRVDRSLATVDPALNRRLWASGGYPTPPTLEAMVNELAGWSRSGRSPSV